MSMRGSRSIVVAMCAVLAASCVRREEAGPGGDLPSAGDAPVVVLALTTVPADVKCVRVMVAGSETVTRTFSVTPNNPATLMVTGLPLGPVVITEAAFDALCADIVANTVATWVSQAPLMLTLNPGTPVSATIILRRPGGLNLSNDFQENLSLVIVPASKDFGSQALGTVGASQTFTVTNMGATTSPPLSITLSNTADFALAGGTCNGATLPAAAICTAVVTFTPVGMLGAKTGTVTISGMGVSVAASLSGSAVPAGALAIAPSSMDFGSVMVGSVTPPVTFTVANTGGVTLPALSLLLSGLSAGEFSITSNACTGAGLAPGVSCMFQVNFHPTSSGAKTAQVTANAGTATASAALTGAGIAVGALTLTPSTANFGSAAVGTTSPPMTFTATNGTGSTLGPITTMLSGPAANEFTIIGNACTAPSLPAGAACAIQLVFSPVSTGAKTATLTMTGSANGSAFTATSALAGTAITSLSLSISPASKDFGPVASGTSGTPQTFLVTNTGAISSGLLTVTVTNSADFVILMNSCLGVTLAPFATCTVTTNFAPGPATIGLRTGTLTVASALGASTSAALAGTAVVTSLSLTPISQDFGSVVIGATSIPATFTATNTGSTTVGPLTAMFTGSAVSDFVITANGCTTLMAGASCMIKVAFVPTAIGPRTAQLTVTTGGATATSALVGTGQPSASLVINPSMGNYGSIPLGSSSSPQVFTVTNNGPATGVPAVALGGAAPSQFAISGNTCNASLPTGASCAIQVLFQPTSVGPQNATLTVSAASGGTVSSATAALTGTGITNTTLVIGPAGRDFGTVTVDTIGPTQALTVTNVGSSATLGPISTSLMGTQFVMAAGGTCNGAVLAAGATCTVQVTFMPTLPALGPQTAMLLVAAGGASASAVLTGYSSNWQSQDIGSPTPIGTWSQTSSSSFAIRGAGNDVYNQADSFRFVYRPISGNATIIARVASVEDVVQWTKGLVMMRESLAAGSRNIAVVATARTINSFRLQVRSTTGGDTTSTSAGVAGAAPIWLRLQRVSNTFTASFSTTGSSWTTIGTTTQTLPAQLLVGLGVTSHKDGQLALGTFENVSITSP